MELRDGQKGGRFRAIDPTIGPVELARSAPFRVGRLLVEPMLRRLSLDDGREELIEPKVMKVLVALARVDGAILTRDDLLSECWPGVVVGDDALNRVIGRLRRLADGVGGGSFAIETIAQVGYRLVPRPAAAPAMAPDAPEPAIAPAIDGPAGHRPLLPAVLIAVLLAAALVSWLAGRPAQPFGYTLRIERFRALDRAAPGELPEMIQQRIATAFDADSLVTAVDGPADFVLRGTIARAGDRLYHELSLEDGHGARLYGWREESAVAPLRGAAQVGMHAAEIVRCGLIGLAEHGRPVARQVRALYLELCGGGTARRRMDIALKVTRIAPDFAAGWSQLAYAYGSAAFVASAEDAPALRAEGRAAAARALAIDPRSASALRVMAWVQPPGTPYRTTEALLRRAVATPNSACSCEHRDYGDFLLDVGRSFAAVGEYQRAVDISPGGSEYLSLAHAWYFVGRPDRAQELLDTVEAMWGDQRWIAFARLDRALARRDWAAAGTLIARDAAGDGDRAIAAAFATVASGDRTGQARLAPAIERLARAPALDAWMIRPPMLDERPALLLALMGREDAALDAVARLMARYGPDGGQLLFDPLIAGLRDRPGYVRLLERSGLMRYWRETRSRPDFCDAADAPAFCGQLR